MDPQRKKRAVIQQAVAKHWCFTWNDADDKIDQDIVKNVLAKHCDYLVYQEEKGADGTKHYQGYAEFTKATRLTAINKLTLPHHPHWEKRAGTRQQARDYAMKADTRQAGPWEAGEKPWIDKAQGKRQDLDDIALMVRDGNTDEEIFEAFPGNAMRFMNHIQKVRFIFKPVRTEDLQVRLLYGPPGTGKTRYFWDAFPKGWSVPVGKDLWFTGYAGQKDVLIDDFAGNIGLTQLLQILDRYPVQLNAKHGHVWWCPNNVFVTTNCHPCNWYDYSERQDSYRALQRRFNEVFVFEADFEGEMKGVPVEDFFQHQKVDGRFHNPPEKKTWQQRHEDF